MKLLASILLLSIFALQVLLKPGIVGYFYINQTAITESLCENKSQPEMQCNGKCFLKKQIQKADDSEKNQQPASQRDTNEFHPFIISGNHFSACSDHFSVILNKPADFFISDFASSVFHPPAA